MYLIHEIYSMGYASSALEFVFKSGNRHDSFAVGELFFKLLGEPFSSFKVSVHEEGFLGRDAEDIF